MFKNLRGKYNKLTLFDKVLVSLFVLGLVFFAYIFFRKSSYIAVTVKVGEDNIRYEPWVQETGTRVWFSQLFYQGMRETDGLGRTMAELSSLRSYDTLPSRKAVYLTLSIRAVYNRASNQYTFKGKPLVVGSPIKLYLDRLLVEGLVTSVEGVNDPRERQELIVEAKLKEENPSFLETSGVENYIAEALTVGQRIMDSDGNVAIEIISKKSENAKRLVTTSDGRVIIQTSPLRKDIYLTLKINALKLGGRYYLFDDTPVLIGASIPLNTDLLSLPIERVESSILLEVSKIIPQ